MGLHDVIPTAPCYCTQERKHRVPIMYDLVVNVLQFCALQLTFTSLDRKSKRKSPKQEDYKGFGA